MKKYFWGLLVFAIGASVYAAESAPWKVQLINVLCGNETDAYTGLAYIIDAKTLSMEQAFANFTADTGKWGAAEFETASAAKIDKVDSGTAWNLTFNYGTGGTPYDFYALILDEDKIYFSNTLKDKSASTSETAYTLQFSSQSNGETTFSHLAAFEGYKGAGYWQKAGATPVPEPTSGMLLILGLSALALRRRRQA